MTLIYRHLSIKPPLSPFSLTSPPSFEKLKFLKLSNKLSHDWHDLICYTTQSLNITRNSLKTTLSAPTIKLSIFIFLHFRVQYDFLTHLAKCQSIMNFRSHSFLTFTSDNLRPPLLDLVPRLGCQLEKMLSYAQKYLTG